MSRGLATRRGLWLALSLLVGAGLAAVGLVTIGDLLAQLWAGVVLTLAAGLLQTRSERGTGEDDDEEPTP